MLGRWLLSPCCGILTVRFLSSSWSQDASLPPAKLYVPCRMEKEGKEGREDPKCSQTSQPASSWDPSLSTDPHEHSATRGTEWASVSGCLASMNETGILLERKTSPWVRPVPRSSVTKVCVSWLRGARMSQSVTVPGSVQRATRLLPVLPAVSPAKSLLLSPWLENMLKLWS